MLTIKQVAEETLPDLNALFCTDKTAERCWCMWFLISVKEFHAAGAAGNKNSFTALMASQATPLGLIAYDQDEPVGWCAVGPRARYARAIKTPTYKGRDPQEDSRVWLVPCFFVRREWRRSAITQTLLAEAVTLAKNSGAVAIEGFPYAGTKRRGKATQVGFETTFSALGFETISRPSPSRSLVRLNF